MAKSLPLLKLRLKLLFLQLSFQVVVEVFVDTQREKETGDRVPFVGKEHLFVQANEFVDVNASQVSSFHFANCRVSDDILYRLIHRFTLVGMQSFVRSFEWGHLENADITAHEWRAQKVLRKIGPWPGQSTDPG